MALVLLASSPALALGFIFGEGTDAPAASSIEDDGMLRVYLKSLGDPASLGMTLAGSYTVEGDRGFRFDRDTAIVLAADGESVLLSVGGLTIDMGPSHDADAAGRDRRRRKRHLHPRIGEGRAL